MVWELFSLGQTPYPGMRTREIFQKLLEGYRLKKPKYATKKIHEIMLDCWLVEPKSRPVSF